MRYLWTDAFAVCNFLGLYVEEGDPEALRLALALIEETHRILGRYRADDPRRGWISGLDDEPGGEHPTIGGLRIGKPLPERGPNERYDAAGEWDRDGQYFHYLTKWMHALESASRVTEEPKFRRWGVELARTAVARFSVLDAAGSPAGLCWKMSIDLTRPLVPSIGQHDPLDGYITLSRLQARARMVTADGLDREIHELNRLCVDRNWYTNDPLGIGGLLVDAHTLASLMVEGVSKEPALLATLLESSVDGVEALLGSHLLQGPAETRLAFRELGLAIGLRAVKRLEARVGNAPETFAHVDGLHRSLGALAQFEVLASELERFWLDPANRSASNWDAHREINEVMLATSLAPFGYLEI